MHTIPKRSFKVKKEMNLAKIIRHFFSTAIVGIEIDNKNCNVVVKFYRGGKNIRTLTKTFKTIPGELPAQAIWFVRKIYAKNPFTYITTLPVSIIQGAIHTNKKEEFGEYGINAGEIVKKSFNDGWSVYVSKEGIAETKKRFLRLEADFIISPFLVLYHLVKDTFQENHCKLYILFQRSNMTMMVTKSNSGVLFGGYYALESEIDSELKIVQNSLNQEEEEVEGADIAADIQKELSKIGDVDLENEEGDDALIEVLKGEGEEDSEAKEESLEQDSEDLGDFSRVSMATKFIQSAMSEFYNNDLYKSEFISEIVVFNPCEIAEETLKQIENFTMLEVKILPCNVAETLVDLGFESYRFFEARGEA